MGLLSWNGRVVEWGDGVMEWWNGGGVVVEWWWNDRMVE